MDNRIAFLPLLVLLFVCSFALNGAAQESSQLDVVQLGVQGMTCMSCANKIRKELTEHQSIESVRVHVSEGTVFVTLQEGKTITDEEIKAIIEESGYQLTSILRPEPASS